MKMNTTSIKELRTITTLDAPIELLWKVWTEPKHIINWWGPAGFTSTIQVMDVQEEGEWKMILHGPDGKNYPNRSIYLEIIPYHKIVFEHFNPHFTTTVFFEEKGDETQIDWSMLFDTPEMYDIVVKAHKADEGQKQNIERLERYLKVLLRSSLN